MNTRFNTKVKYLAMIVLGLNNYYYCYRSYTRFFNKLKSVSFFLMLILLVLFAQSSSAQTTKTVGSGGNYTTLKLAFDAINAGTVTGTITLQIIGSTTETTAAVLNASGTGSASYASVNIYPTSTGLSISGNYNSHMIDLNGADNVTFDGRVNATGSTKDLTITNSNTGTSATTIRMYNSAENNTIKYCTIKGSETNQARGVIFFSTSTSGNGNDNNLIDNNNITSDAAGRVNNAIYSLGTSGRDNSGNTISNNNIYDVWRNTVSSYSIQLSSYSSAWSISGNSFYEFSDVAPTGGWTYCPIKINYTSGINFNVTGNFIGGKSAQCGGGTLTVNAATTHLFQGIMLNVGTSTPSSVQNNTIKNINYTASSTSIWQGIYIAAGAVNVGTTTGNTIGAGTGTGSINVTGNVTATVVQGINFAGSGTVNVQNNTIGAITVANSNSANASNFYAINRSNTGTSTISNNIIGSTSTSNSINVTSTSTSYDQSAFGIRNTTGGNSTYNNNTIANLTNGTTNTSTSSLGLINGILSNYGITTITNNTIFNLTIANANTASSSAASVTGIAVASTNALNTISGNTIYNLSNTYPSFSGSVIGLYFGSTGMYTTISHTVTKNFIHSLSVNSSSSSIYGIKVNTGQTTYANNIISIGGNTATTIYGLYELGSSSNNNSLYFNTVYISGSLSSGVTNKSYALFSAVSSNVRNIRNNIFVNARSTTSGSNLHYAAYFNYSSASSVSLNYNDYYVPGTGGVLGYHNSTNKTALPIIAGKDTNSTIVNPVFTNAGGTSVPDYYSTVSLSGASGTGILTDYYGIIRSVTSPKIGALEGTTHTYTWQGGTSTDFGTASNWAGGVVPPDGADISFASNPDRNCVLDQNRNLGIVTNAQGTDLLVVNGKQLTLTETIIFSNGAQIDATTASSVIIFAGSSAQSIPSGAFVSNTVDGLTLNNSNGLTLNGDLTVTQTLTLTSGDLNIGANTLTLNGAISTASGMLNGGSTSNMIIGGSAASTTLPNVLLNNFTLNRANGITLSGDLNTSGTLALTNGTLSVGANTLAIFGNTITRTNGSIDASNSSATLEFANSSLITLPAALFSGAINNLTISGAGGVTAGSDMTVNGVLNLDASNPSATRGLLEMTIDYTGYPGTSYSTYLNSHTLYMGATATTIGTGDVTGTIRRNTIVENTPYTFGHQYTTILLTTGTMPNALSVTVTIGNTPPGDGIDDSCITAAYKRTYEIVPTVPGGYTSLAQVTANFHYLDNEMTSSISPYHVNTEANTVTWDYDIGGGIPADEHGRADYDFTNKFIGLANVPISYFINIPTHQWRTIFTLRDFRENHYTWNGSISTDWKDALNWTISTGGAGIPSSGSHVVIPNVANTNNRSPVLPATATINSLTIENGGALVMGSNTLIIENSFSGGWEDQNPNGNDPGTSTVIFSMHGTTISGNARFYNVEISDGADITNKIGNRMIIQNTITKTGTAKWYADMYGATVEYRGGDQTVLSTDGSPQYHNLILNGSASKTLPSSLIIHGNLTIKGTTSATATGSISIGGDLLIESGASFSTGTYDHTIGGNFDNSGTFTANSSKTITLNGTAAQSIYGDSTTSFENLTINNTNGVNTYSNVNVNSTLTLSNGNLNVGGGLFRPNGKLNRTKDISISTDKINKSNLGNSSYRDNLLSSGDITLTLNGTITTGSGTLTGGDSSVINIAGSGATATLPAGTFNNLTVNRSNGVNLSGDATINGTLSLTNGILNTNGHILTFGITAADPVESSAGRIVGTSRILNIPVGSGAFSFLSCSIASGVDDLGNVSVVRKTGDIAVINVNGNTSIKSNWDITSDNPPSGARTVEYKWLSDLDNGKTFSNINKAINYFSSDNGVTWNVHGSPIDVSATNPRVLSYSTTHFSYWVASDQNSPLPVTLSSLNSNVNGRNVKLNWTTASEINNKGFEVERKTLIGSWSKVGFIQGKGTVNTTSNYSFEDRFLTTGKYSYRLKQIDFNGNFEYHNMNGVVEIGVPTKYDLSQNYPNPFNPVTKINFELPFDSKVSMIVYDMTGREIKTLVNEVKTAGYYTQLFDASGISSGTYFYRIIANANGKDYIATKKMILVK